jgi:hypothetical protein
LKINILIQQTLIINRFSRGYSKKCLGVIADNHLYFFIAYSLINDNNMVGFNEEHQNRRYHFGFMKWLFVTFSPVTLTSHGKVTGEKLPVYQESELKTYQLSLIN